MPDNPEFTAAQVNLRADVQRHHCLGKIETRCPSCGMTTLFITDSGHLCCSWLACKNPTAINQQPAPDAGTGPLSAFDSQLVIDMERAKGFPEGCPHANDGRSVCAACAVDAGTGEARTREVTVEEAMELAVAAEYAAEEQPPAPVPDLAELLSDEAVYQIALNAPDDLPDEGWAPNVQPLKASIIALLTPWLVSREAASRRRIEDAETQRDICRSLADQSRLEKNLAEAALAQLRREAQAALTEWEADDHDTPTVAALRATLARLPVEQKS